MRGLLTVDQERPFVTIARRVHGPQAAGQRVHPFRSQSPWSGRTVLEQGRAAGAATPALREGSVLILEESADVKAGAQTAGAGAGAGAGRHDNGRLGQGELSQVGPFLALANEARRFWCWLDGEVFVPQGWVAPERAKLRQRLGIPPERHFATTIELGWQMIQRLRAAGVPFEAVLCDEL